MPLRLCLIVLLTLFAHQVVAQEDLLLPITIQADRATVSESLGRSEYQGNVIIAQGLLRITADQVNLTSRDKTLALIEENNALLAKAPKGKEGTSALMAIKAEIAAIETSITEANTIYTAGEYLVALDKVKSANEKATAINVELTEVIAKYKGKR